MASPAKKQRTEEAAASPAAVEEVEQDAKKDSAPKISQQAAFLTPDTTLNVLPSTVGNMMSAMSEGALANLVAGARANIGIKSGRYMFEAKILEKTSQKSRARFGFAAEGSLFLGEDDNSICFDNEGFLVSNKKKSKCSTPFACDVMVAVVLNLDSSSPNCNTISLFKNGVRAGPPQPLPESLKGKTLFPAVSYKSATVHVNFAAPVVPLPFKCKAIQEATQKDAVVTKYDEPADGKYTALFPVSLPDEGTFDWVDAFIEKNPDYTELSDRALIDWAIKSGLSANKKKECNDKPDVGLGNGMDNMKALKKALMQVAALQPRNFVIMEVKANLMKEERLANLAQFKTSAFKTVAEVVVGEPAATFKRRVQSRIAEAKQEASDKVFKAKQADEKRQWAAKKKQKEAEKLRKKNEKERKKKLAEITKKRAKEMADKKAKAEGKEPEEEKEEAAVESEEEAEEADEPEPMEEEPPKVGALTAEEKALRFFKHAVPDLLPYAMNTSFTKFSLPDGDEGFDSVKYSWNKDKDAAVYLQKWISEKKQTTRVEDITPSASFKQKWAEWQKTLQAWKTKQNEYKAVLAKKAADKNARIHKKAALKKAAEAKAKMLEAKKEKAKAEGKELEEEKEEEKALMEVEEEEEEEEPQVDFDGIDVFGVEDILDVGGKAPLFKDFQFEDFAMMSLRFELNLLVASFAQDCNDPDRTGAHVDHLAFYYQKYFGKSLTAQSFGVQKLAEAVALVDDTVSLNDKSVVESLMPSDLESSAIFVKLTEDARRMRNLQVDMGVEGAKLKIRSQGETGGQNGEGQGQKRNWEGQKQGGNWGKQGAWGKRW